MPSLFKQRIVRYVDQAGNRVMKSTPGAIRKVSKSKKWYGEFTDDRGLTQRVPLATDRSAAQSMLGELIRKAEQRKTGIIDRYEEYQRQPLTRHIDEYSKHLEAKGDTAKHCAQTANRIRKLCTGCKFLFIQDIDPTKVEDWLNNQSRNSKRFSAQTRNFYLDSIKYFCNWLVKRQRCATNPLISVERVSVEVDRRHDRRALTDEEFVRLISAAKSGPLIQGVNGKDRAMLYVLAAWTGFRRNELSSLTRRSFDLNSTPACVKLKAKDSKRRKLDTIPLHDTVVAMLQEWFRTKRVVSDTQALFDLKTPKGHFRKTSTMMKKDLALARSVWLAETDDAEEVQRRNESCFLTYEDADGLFADFHANRHTFVSNLSKSGVPLSVAQKLARHSDPRLTANRYTHVELEEKANAIGQLPGVPDKKDLVTGMVTGEHAILGHLVTSDGTTQDGEFSAQETTKPLEYQGFSDENESEFKVHLTGFEPVTFGFVDRCSIQLS